jgi:hypothetical protein
MTVAKATRRITKLRVREMSLVGEGDNPHADVLILKHRQIIGVDLDVVKQQLSEVRDGALEIAKALSEGGTPMNIEELTAKLDRSRSRSTLRRRATLRSPVRLPISPASSKPSPKSVTMRSPRLLPRCRRRSRPTAGAMIPTPTM